MKTSDNYNLNLWRAIVSANAGHRREHCNHVGEDCNPHHVVSRDYKSVRYSPANGVWLCHSCHRYAHEHPKAFMRFITGRRGAAWLQNLTTEKNKIVKFNNFYRHFWKLQLLSMLREAA